MSDKDIPYHEFHGDKTGSCNACDLPFTNGVHNPCRQMAELVACIYVWCHSHSRPERIALDPEPLLRQGGWYADKNCLVSEAADSVDDAEEFGKVSDPEGYVAFRRSLGFS